MKTESKRFAGRIINLIEKMEKELPVAYDKRDHQAEEFLLMIKNLCLDEEEKE